MINETIKEINLNIQQYIKDAKLSGQNDARTNDSDTIASSIAQIKSRFQSQVFNLENAVRNEVIEIQEKYLSLSDEVKHITNNKDEAINNERISNIEITLRTSEEDLRNIQRGKITELGNRINSLQAELSKSESEILTTKNSMNDIVFDNKLNPFLGFVIIVVITFIEIPFTQSALLVTRAPVLITWSFAFLICLILAFSAHFAGGAIKSKTDKVLSNIALGFGVVTIFITASMRTMYVKKLDFSVNNLFTLDAIIFTLLGLGIYFICMMISYYSHNSSSLAGKKVKAFKRKLSRLAREKAEISDKLKKCNTNKDNSLSEFQSGIKSLREKASQEIIRIKEYKSLDEKTSARRKAALNYNKIIKKYASLESGISENFNQALSVYKHSYSKVAASFFGPIKDPIVENELETLNSIFESTGKLVLPLSNEELLEL